MEDYADEPAACSIVYTEAEKRDTLVCWLLRCTVKGSAHVFVE
jgi:hypothetical protein